MITKFHQINFDDTTVDDIYNQPSTSSGPRHEPSSDKSPSQNLPTHADVNGKINFVFDIGSIIVQNFFRAL